MGKDKNSTSIHRFRLIRMVVAFAITILIVLYGISSGTIDFTWQQVWGVLRGSKTEGLAHQIIWNVRAPRVLTGMLAGMNLAVAGSLLQGILRNPMASPNIIGVNAGAGLAAVVMMVVFPGAIRYLPVASFLGALMAAMVIYLLSMRRETASATVHLVLAGVALSAFFNAVTSGLMTLNADELEVTYNWLLGSLSGRGWPYFYTLLPYSVAGLLLAIFISPKVNLFVLGEEMGNSIGISVYWYRTAMIGIAAVLAGSAVSVAGTIGFVGLIAPHMARLIIGADYRYQIPMAAILGGGLLILSDTVARIIFQPFELSVGVVTSILGAPFFLYLLYQKRSANLF
ncbi:FecCD family ABC transporter permease [Tindallia californiensis]|uniref:Iron complex transport system permease protein n=1 Tax=Tindallia californiensis TaxID=159292 RepID=A0A1H3MCN9_9FIRM|nr:iron ABC transporter permease [Tindallia californiensis]SDY74356.1 iron complex transport system permease protein [Tindallia californiensis]